MANKQSLLLVDADPKSLRVLDVSLKKAGFEVITATGAREALARMEEHPPDLVISEAHMPEMDGFDLVRHIKEKPEWAKLPIIFLTSRKAIEDKIRGLELGVEDYLTKPIYIKEITTRVRILLQRRERERLESRRGDGRAKFQGELADLSLVDLVQTIELNRKSGIIHMTNVDGRRAAVYFRDGRVIDAEADRLSGVEAVYRLFSWSEGGFEVEFKPIRRKDVVELGPQALLMEGMRRLDEWTRVLEAMPPLQTVFEVDYHQLAEHLGEIPDEVNGILRLFDGRRQFLQVIEDSDFPDLDALSIIGKLFADKIITPVFRERRAPAADTQPGRLDRWLGDTSWREQAAAATATVAAEAPALFESPTASGPAPQGLLDAATAPYVSPPREIEDDEGDAEPEAPRGFEHEETTAAGTPLSMKAVNTPGEAEAEGRGRRNTSPYGSPALFPEEVPEEFPATGEETTGTAASPLTRTTQEWASGVGDMPLAESAEDAAGGDNAVTRESEAFETDVAAEPDALSELKTPLVELAGEKPSAVPDQAVAPEATETLAAGADAVPVGSADSGDSRLTRLGFQQAVPEGEPAPASKRADEALRLPMEAFPETLPGVGGTSLIYPIADESSRPRRTSQNHPAAGGDEAKARTATPPPPPPPAGPISEEKPTGAAPRDSGPAAIKPRNPGDSEKLTQSEMMDELGMPSWRAKAAALGAVVLGGMVAFALFQAGVLPWKPAAAPITNAVPQPPAVPEEATVPPVELPGAQPAVPAAASAPAQPVPSAGHEPAPGATGHDMAPKAAAAAPVPDEHAASPAASLAASLAAAPANPGGPSPAATPAAAATARPATAPAAPPATLSFSEQVNACRSAHKKERYRQVLSACSQALAVKPAADEAPELMAMLANAELDRGNTAEALKWGKKALALNPNHADAWVFVGGAQQTLGRLSEARMSYQKYLEIAPQGRYADELRAILDNLRR